MGKAKANIKRPATVMGIAAHREIVTATEERMFKMQEDMQTVLQGEVDKLQRLLKGEREDNRGTGDRIKQLERFRDEEHRENVRLARVGETNSRLIERIERADTKVREANKVISQQDQTIINMAHQIFKPGGES